MLNFYRRNVSSQIETRTVAFWNGKIIFQRWDKIEVKKLFVVTRGSSSPFSFAM
jgi:hypothetical protein